MIKTRCKRCRRLIEYGNSFCNECKPIVGREKRDNRSNMTKEADKFVNTSMWRSIRKEIILRDKGVCRLCMLRGFIWNKSLQVHHIYKRCDYPSMAYERGNLVTLCRNCHEEVEKLEPKEQCKLLNINLPQEEIHYLL